MTPVSRASHISLVNSAKMSRMCLQSLFESFDWIYVFSYEGKMIREARRLTTPAICLMRGPPEIGDLIGRRFGRLVVIGFSHNNRQGAFWWVDCDCGGRKVVLGQSLNRGATTSCGCVQREAAAEIGRRSLDCRGGVIGNRKHGRCGTRIYRIYFNMLRRCNNPKDTAYERYGGRGITVCDEWKHDMAAFFSWAEGNGYSDDLEIDRIDNDAGYRPDNCRWVTARQNCNNRRGNRIIRFDEQSKTVSEWAREVGIDKCTITSRLKHGWSIERALSQPVKV